MSKPYPSIALLKLISDWPGTPVSYRQLLDRVSDAWDHDMGSFTEGHLGYYRLVTGGWSGNEDLIDALQKNSMFWLTCWMKSERGGLFEFEIPKYALEAKEK